MSTVEALSPTEARRIALRAQQFGGPRSRGKPSVAQLRRVLRVLGAVAAVLEEIASGGRWLSAI